MTRTAAPMNGKARRAKSVSRHSRANMTVTSATIEPTCRIAMTSTVDDSRASRPTSRMTREVSSAECTSLKNASDSPWMWR